MQSRFDKSTVFDLSSLNNKQMRPVMNIRSDKNTHTPNIDMHEDHTQYNKYKQHAGVLQVPPEANTHPT